MKKPDFLPPYPPAPEGMKWAYRGTGWNPGRKVVAAHIHPDLSCKWVHHPEYFETTVGGFDAAHYAELVKAGGWKNVTDEPPQEKDLPIVVIFSTYKKIIESMDQLHAYTDPTTDFLWTPIDLPEDPATNL